MSSSDIFDVLNIKKAKPQPATVEPSHSSSPRPPVTGIQRELYNLLGTNQPPIALSSKSNEQSRFKEKLQANGKVVPWTNAPFKPNDYVVLNHWIRGSSLNASNDNTKSTDKLEKLDHNKTEQELPPSKFKQFNVHPTLPEFTEIEYNDFMSDIILPSEISKADNKPNDEIITTNKDIKESGSGLEAGDNQKAESANEGSKTPNDSDKDHKAKNDTWTYEETLQLFHLCRQYDMKWFIIFDRYEDNGKTRTLEDLKSQFYKVSKAYFHKKDPKNPLLTSLDFRKDKEIERKNYLQRLLARSAAEIAEEEALIIESRKFEVAAKRTLNEREALLRLLDSPHSEQSVSRYLTSQGMSQLYTSLLSDKSRKRKHPSSNSIPENPWMKQQQQFAQQRQQLQQQHHQQQQQQLQQRIQQQENEQKSQNIKQELSVKPNDSIPSIPSTSKKTKKQKQEEQQAQKKKSESARLEQLLSKFSEEERTALGVIVHEKKLNAGVYLRSTRIPSFKPALQNKVNLMMQELGLPMRPTMVTKRVMERQEHLLKQIANLADLKKHYDKLEAEVEVRK
ncbi:hypothetical protein TBLA_0G01430 [Henningerozyma blattae CBS 6284]|uniref:SWR1-complex protein 4 n=1 Tax=Henningerozyma blattae (strain ATCC 34711 / CBS 6284 / DSM 70876 / NBRC 10599 / NRRL Y-10934 / UCD 77-7) TaxID=1071380 RepID=I2H6T7_HENB6|nr:hypothetical protein TBLA_0G01430 [Tetrapisispora blattae CBS 6284]CCH62089.1 hypothetical protein TBLA_0G01430 [Tetrapisispora blattae CBS 6284]